MSIYLDNAATTKIRDEVFDVMVPFLKDTYGNPSSIYKLGRDAKKAIEDAREEISNVINCDKREFYFTGSGTESDNWAIKGIVEASTLPTKHVISTKVEHHGVLHVLEYLERKGVEVTYIDVDKFGCVNPKDIEKAIKENTILISVMFANNEIGTIMPIKEIGAIAKEHKIYFHTDAVQAFGHLPIDVKEFNIDLMSMSAHKIHGPKGVGGLYVGSNVKIKPFLHGGAQERKRRPSTENVAGIVGFARAATLAASEMDETNKRIANFRDKLINGILTSIPRTFLNGHPTNRLPNNVNISFEFIEGEGILLLLDMKGICASSGSACTSGSLDPSHVLLATGLKHEEAHGSLRLSLSMYTTEEEVDYVIEELKPIIERLRQMSPLS